MFLCSPGVRKSHQRTGHRVTFDVDASYAALRSAYNSYIKHSDKNNTSAKEKKFARYLAEYYQVWDEHFWMTSEKGQVAAPATICWEQKEHKIGFAGLAPRPKTFKIHGLFVPATM